MLLTILDATQVAAELLNSYRSTLELLLAQLLYSYHLPRACSYDRLITVPNSRNECLQKLLMPRISREPIEYPSRKVIAFQIQSFK